MMPFIIPLIIHGSPYEVIPNISAILKTRILRIRNAWLIGVEYEVYASTLSSVQSLSRVWGLFVTPWITARQASQSIANSWSPPKPMSLSWWCHPTILSSVVPFSSCPQSFPASGSFPVSQFFASGGQSIGVSASASALPMNTQDWYPSGWTGWISLQSKGLSRVSPNTTVWKH